MNKAFVIDGFLMSREPSVLCAGIKEILLCKLSKESYQCNFNK
ncbi:hypothetical protein [uncultured Eubacterium sp.]|nr:hypothetical protein [uncultured Eubacterium sp.]